jgi:dCMP deaminase
MIIGVTGYFCAGKDTLAASLEQKNFVHISLSDMIREEIQSRGQTVTLNRLTQVGTELRQSLGAGVLAIRALKRMNTYTRYVVTSIRHPGEVEALRLRPDFVLVFIDAPRRVRYERSIARARKGDNLPTFEEFVAAEKRQMRGEDPDAQQLAFCREEASLVLRNDGAVEAFRKRIDKALREILTKHMPARPTWDEYFMNIAIVTSSRSNCLSRHVGAVIVQDRQIVSTGYNGTPKGIQNCNEGGCPRCWAMGESGMRLDECLCVHAEENAIVQAACNGIGIQGATLYTTFCPCSYCAKSIINAGVKRVVYREAYAMDEITTRLFTEADIGLTCLGNAGSGGSTEGG